jgi:L-asparaginase
LNKQPFPVHIQEMSGTKLTPVRIIITGGTFDKDYDELSGALTFRDTHLPEILRASRITVPVQLEIVRLIDSLEMQDGHRQEIVTACARAPESTIVMTHGTDTMAATARFLGAAAAQDPALGAKSIVLTGAMLPYTVLHSDAAFNLGFALAAAQLVARGIHLCMNGRVFAWDNARKNTSLGIFEAITPDSATLDSRAPDFANPEKDST